MSLTRSRFLGLLGAGAVGAALAGCAEAARPTDTTAPEFGRPARGSVSLWCRGGLSATSRQLVDAFHRAQRRIRVTVTPVQDGQYVTKLATAIRGGRAPDLVDMDVINSALFAYRDAFADLTPLVDKLFFKDELSPGHFGPATRAGRHYAVPGLSDNSALWCNRELFDRAGLDLDQATASFDGYLDAARAISALGGDVHGWHLAGNSAGALAFTVQPHLWAAGTDLVSEKVEGQRGTLEGNEPLRRTLRLLHTMWAERLMPRGAFSDDGTRWTTEFYRGKVGMLPAGYGVVAPSAPKGFLDSCAVRLLSGPDGGHSFFGGGDVYAIPNGAQNPAAAWEFVRFALDPAPQRGLTETGYTPVRSDVANDGYRKRFPLAVPPLDDLDSGRSPRSLAYNRLFNQSDGPWLAMLRRAVFGGEIDAAVREAQEGFDTILRQGDA